MTDDSYFRFDVDNNKKLKYSHNHQKGNGWTENTQPHILHKNPTRIKDNWENGLNLRHTRDSNSEILKRSFVYNGSVLWNSLRHEVKLADNVNTFKRMYKDMILFPSQLCS